MLHKKIQCHEYELLSQKQNKKNHPHRDIGFNTDLAYPHMLIIYMVIMTAIQNM